MTRDEFKAHVASSVEASIRQTEKNLGVSLPRNMALQWGLEDETRYLGAGNVVEAITARVYVDSEHIYPCVDLGPCRVLPEGKLLLIGLRAGYTPAPFQKNWTGRESPFALIYGGDFVGPTPPKMGSAPFRTVVPKQKLGP